MNKNIIAAIIGRYESKAFGLIEEFEGATLAHWGKLLSSSIAANRDQAGVWLVSLEFLSLTSPTGQRIGGIFPYVSF